MEQSYPEKPMRDYNKFLKERKQMGKPGFAECSIGWGPADPRLRRQLESREAVMG